MVRDFCYLLRGILLATPQNAKQGPLLYAPRAKIATCFLLPCKAMPTRSIAIRQNTPCKDSWGLGMRSAKNPKTLRYAHSAKCSFTAHIYLSKLRFCLSRKP